MTGVNGGLQLKVAAVSLGCAKNRIDTEEILGLLGKQGYVICSEPTEADIIIVNTCSFIEDAQEESIDTLIKMASLKRLGRPRIVAAGCLVEHFGETLLKELPELDGAMGVHSYNKVADFLPSVFRGKRETLVSPPTGPYRSLGPRLLTSPPHSVYVKIAEGCDNCCSYCLIPSFRGNFRSRSSGDIIREVEDLAGMGAREINLVAQDPTSYGRDLKGSPDFPGLLEQILQSVPDPLWFRILYAYPTRITEELIQVMKRDERVCPYLDIPLQHVDSDLLEDMGRPYSYEHIVSLLTKLRREMPDLALRTTYMTGFPGEDKSKFLRLLDFLHRYPVDHMGAFYYSAQEGTAAEKLKDRVALRIKKKRRQTLLFHQQFISLQLKGRFTGRRLPVLVERPVAGKPGYYQGRTRYQAPEVDGAVLFNSRMELSPGDLVSLKIAAAGPYHLLGIKPRTLHNNSM